MKSINLTLEDHKKIKEHILIMLKEFDRICVTYGINYSIFGGTLLGAIRHKGFIPWDDDADICMLREDYEKFRKISNKLDPSICFFQDNFNDKNYLWGYGKLRRTGTTYIRTGQEHIKCKTGVFVDIFPLDDVPKSTFFQILQDFHCYIIRKILWSRVGKISDSKLTNRLFYKLLSIIPTELAFRHIDLYKKKSKNDTQNLVRTLCYTSIGKLYFKHPIKYRYGMPKEWFKKLQYYEFDGIKILGPVSYDEVLKFEFNDYMKLPPIEKRVQHAPVSEIKL